MPKRDVKNKGKDMNSFADSYSNDEVDTNAENSRYNIGKGDNSDDSDDSDKVSDISDDSDFEEGGDNDSKKLGTKFLENVIKYLEVDDTIKNKQSEHREEVKNLKDTKGELEGFIIRYLDRKGKDQVNLGENKGRLVKETKDSKSAIKTDTIREGIMEGLKAAKLVEQEAETVKLINSIMDSIDNKRTVTKRTTLRRVNAAKSEKSKKSKKSKGKDKDKDNSKKNE